MASVPPQTPPFTLLSFVYVSAAAAVAVVMRGQVPGLASDRPRMYIQSHWPGLTVFACSVVVSFTAGLHQPEFLLMKNPFPIGYFPEKMRLSNAWFEKLPAARAAPGVTPPSVETASDGKAPSLSPANSLTVRRICLALLVDSVRRAFLIAAGNALRPRPARMAMMEMTTRSSMSVKPCVRFVVWS